MRTFRLLVAFLRILVILERLTPSVLPQPIPSEDLLRSEPSIQEWSTPVRLSTNLSDKNSNETNGNRRNRTLLLFMAITSAPEHFQLRQAARDTWLFPCRSNRDCDYRFFVDCIKNPNQDPVLDRESFLYKDIIFRNSCSLLRQYHPNPHINYGNSPPVDSNMHYRLHNGSDEVIIDLPDYFFRRRYKIDWKVCFLQWIHEHYELVHYYAFVEDDSFVCTENLLFQMELLKNISKEEPILEFRTGTPMFDGFDDSSTIMTRKIAETFVNHYLEPGFNCSNVFNHPQNASTVMGWLSWGNSWISKLCNWTGIIEEKYGYRINRPNVICSLAEARAAPHHHPSLELHLPCTSRPLILHHSKASHILLKEHSPSQVGHLCEYMLLIDKVKHPHATHQLWNLTSRNRRFHDFSQVFRENDLRGWPPTLQRLMEEEEECSANKINSVGSTSKQVAYPCLFDEESVEQKPRTRLLRTRREHKIRTNVNFRDYFGNMLHNSVLN